MVRTRNTPGRTSLALTALALGLVLAACASGAAAPVGGGADGGNAAAPAASAARGGGTGTGTGGGNAGGGNAGGGNGTPGGAPAGGETEPGTGETALFGDIARLVYTGTMRLRVEKLEAAVKAGRDAVLAAGGYIAASRQSIEGTSETASVTYRIPVAAWEETIELLRTLGDQIGEEIDSSEVTAQIVDLEARIRNHRVHEAAVQRIAEQAATFEEILEGQDRLASVRNEIERLEAQLASLENEADLGTLTVTYGTEAAAVVRAAEAVTWDGSGEVARATATLVGMLQSLASFGIWFGIVWLPAIALVLALALLVRAVLRRSGLLERLPAAPADPRLPGA